MGLLEKIKALRREKCSVVLVAAGSATRMGGTDKINAILGGRRLIWYALDAFQQNEDTQEIILVVREEQMEELSAFCAENHFTKVKAVVSGGDDRLHSVLRGVDHVSPKARFIAVHDGARPLVSQKVISETFDLGVKFGAAAPGLAVKDTIKVAENGAVAETPVRENLFAVQTPQIFDADVLKAALENAIERNLSVTDDCSCVEKMGMRVFLSEGEERNLKITTPMDLSIAELYLKGACEN